MTRTRPSACFSTIHSPNRRVEPGAVDQQVTGSLPVRGGANRWDNRNASPRRLMVKWSGAARSRPSTEHRFDQSFVSGAAPEEDRSHVSRRRIAKAE